jgi:hypothetical protein
MVIIYKSNTGYTEQYAKLLSRELDIPAYSAESIPACHYGQDVIFMGWVMAGKIMGYGSVVKKCRVCAVVGVGMGPDLPELVPGFRKAMHLTNGMAVFYLQGGFDLSRLKGPFKLIMQVKNKEIAARLTMKSQRTSAEDATLAMTRGEHSCVCPENLSKIVAWYRSR